MSQFILNCVHNFSLRGRLLARAIYKICLLSSILLPLGQAFADDTPLPADQAFKLSVTLTSPQQVVTQWQITPGYYLYRKQTQIIFETTAPVDIRFPQGELRYDIVRGRYEVFAGNLIVPAFFKEQPSMVKMRVEYQGCSQNGFCYPPMSQAFNLDFSKHSVLPLSVQLKPEAVSLKKLSQDQNSVRHLLASQSLSVMLLIFTGIGFLLAFTPCVWPMIPILTGIIVGQSRRATLLRSFLLSCTYVFGAAITYALAGLSVAWMGGSLQVWLQQPWIIMAVSGLFALLGLSLFGLYDLRLPHQLHTKVIKLSNKQKGGTYLGVFGMGMISTLIVSPCVTAPLVGVLLYIGQTGDTLLGASALFAMGLGMGIPLILIGVSAGKWLPKSGAWMEVLKKIFGLFMFAMAVWLLSRVVPLPVTLFLLGVLIIVVAIFIGVYLPLLIGKRLVSHKLGYIFGLIGVLVMAGVVISPHTVSGFVDLASLTASNSNFVVVHNIADLNKQLTLAQAAKKPVILDFYADWCDACVVMDKTVFSQTAVRKAMSAYILLRADLSANNADDEALLKQYQVIAPPMVLFFNAQGEEMQNKRIVGEVDANEFLIRLSSI